MRSGPRRCGKRAAAVSARRVAAVVAAAGLSSRMGAFKPLLPLGKQTLLEAALAPLRAAGASPIVVVTGYRGAEIEARLRGQAVLCVRNDDYAASDMLASLRLGLRALKGGFDRVLLLPGDAAGILAETVRRLLETEGEVLCPVFDGRPGHPAALSAAAARDLLDYDGPDGLRGFLRTRTVCEMETHDPGAALDADTPEDYEKLRALWRGREEDGQ